LVAAGVLVHATERPGPRLADPEPPAVPPRRVRHREAARDHLAAGNVDQDAAAGFVRTPAGKAVGLAQRRDITRPAVDHRQAVQVAAVRRLERGDERRPPARYEARVAVAGHEAREPGVDEPELAPRAVPGHLVDLDVAGDVRRA